VRVYIFYSLKFIIEAKLINQKVAHLEICYKGLLKWLSLLGKEFNILVRLTSLFRIIQASEKKFNKLYEVKFKKIRLFIDIYD